MNSEIDAEDTGARKDEELNVLPHHCDRCGKGIPSGKATGNSKLHVQHEKGRDGPGEFKPLSESGADIACCVCGKRFRSWKAVFGHMRSHPDRPWRGMRPPPAKQISSSVSTLSDSHTHQMESLDRTAAVGHVINLTKSVSGWSVTAKSKRKSALDLGFKFFGESSNSSHRDSMEGALQDVEKSESNPNQRTLDLLSSFEKQSETTDELVKLGKTTPGFEREPAVITSSRSNFKDDDDGAERKLKIRKLSNLETVRCQPLIPARPKMYSCSHVSSHNRNIRRSNKLPEKHSACTSGCGAAAPFSQFRLMDEAGQTGCKLLKFDLNELPPLEDEEASN